MNIVDDSISIYFYITIIQSSFDYFQLLDFEFIIVVLLFLFLHPALDPCSSLNFFVILTKRRNPYVLLMLSYFLRPMMIRYVEFNYW